MPQLIGDEFSGSRTRAAPAARPPNAPYNRGNALVVVTAKIAVNEREELERLAVAGQKSVSAVVRDAIQGHIRPGRRSH